jgi:MinD superfamily P-loop ATPase
MDIAIASGKGGTGKTTVAVNLALVAARAGWNAFCLDCDVEEPNGHLFLRPEMRSSRPVGIPVPEVDEEKCTGCGTCAEICAYSAIACIKKKVLVFPELCHGCGGCALACPEGAIAEEPREIGVVEKGPAGPVGFVHGKLKVGEAMSPPLIRAVKHEKPAAGDRAVNFLDAPPGTSCPVIVAVSGADFVLLVTEPTPFGLNDLGLALEMVRELGLPHAVVVNRHDDGNESARTFCREHEVEILAEIPDDRRVAEAYSRGETAVDAVPGCERVFLDLWDGVRRMVGEDGAVQS